MYLIWIFSALVGALEWAGVWSLISGVSGLASLGLMVLTIHVAGIVWILGPFHAPQNGTSGLLGISILALISVFGAAIGFSIAALFTILF